MNTLLTTEEVAAYLKIDIREVNFLCRQGRLQCIQISPRKRRFSSDMLDDFVAKNTLSTDSPVTVDTENYRRLPSNRKGGSKKSGSGVSVRTQLLEEMRSW